MKLGHWKLPTSLDEGWHDIADVHPAVWRTFAFLVIPFSLVPPLMLYYYGPSHAELTWLSGSTARWQFVATLFFMTELVTVPLMAWAIKGIAEGKQIRVDYKDCFKLATLAAIPMWLSALGLWVNTPWGLGAVLFAGLFLAAFTLNRGAAAVLDLHESIETQELSYEVFSVGGLLWVVLCVLTVLPLL